MVFQAQAQMSSSPSEVAPARQTAPGQFMVFFPLGSSELDADARQVISEAAADYRRVREAQVSIIGHTDTSGSAELNQRLSDRRAEAMEVALVREGVPATSIVTIARGQEDLLVPTADGVREPENRRVEILVPQPPAPPAPAPVVETSPPPPAPPPLEPDRFTFALGPVYGHNFGESDGKEGGDKTQNDLVGAELTFRALPSFLGSLSLKQMALWSINGLDDGVNGRSVASLDFAPDFGMFRPTLAINGGGVYGPGFQDGFVSGPEIRFDIMPVAGFNIGLKAAYDY